MRTIKFRGKRIDDLEWVFGYYIGINNISHTILNDSGAVWTIDPAAAAIAHLRGKGNIKVKR